MKLPASAKAKWIALIPLLNFRIVRYDTNKVVYFKVERFQYLESTILTSKGNGAFLYHGLNRCVKDCFELVGLQSSGYAEQFDRTCPAEFVTRMLSEVVGNHATSGSFYIFERLDR
jgi:hypothetical protein